MIHIAFFILHENTGFYHYSSLVVNQ